MATRKNLSIEDMNIEELKKNTVKCINNKDLRGAERYFKEYIELIIFNLLLFDQFFGNFLIRIQRQISFKMSAPAAVSLKKGAPILTLNPLLILRFTHKEVKAILIHEIYHLLHFHILRSKENNNRFDSYIENIAMDIAINQFIPDIPDVCVVFDNFCKMFNLDYYSVRRNEAFEYYLDLIQNSDSYKEQSEKFKQMMKDLQDAIDQLNNSESGNVNGNNKGNGNSQSITDQIDKILDKKYPIDHSMWKESDGTDIQNMKEIIKNMVNEVAKNCGSVPSNIQDLIKKINEPVIIKWQDELKLIVGSIRCPYKLTPLRRPRRQMDRMDLKGRLSNRKVKIAVAIDTSGSMGKKELSFVFSEIFHILKLVNFELTIIECDAEIQNVYKAKNFKEVNMEVKGRGGTRFTPVFKYLKEDHKLSSSSRPDILIYFTDGYGESELDENYKINPSIKLMWVLTGKKKDLSCKNPWTNKIKQLNIYEH